ncbi:hypothetical protein AAJ76_1600048343 [Vairimorpha ceranae]|uniref:Uncharacterized protein n=1 Tax=Vairimorpha ceranae TaxID=40302 RepID=A0A0F9WRV1_9MICR|nr:hypothetical protein AAJ76_1600048343 [Vairimorpha ceranae]KKO75618.1 hypothetical protein AAJ76_1600048343 [Vairimorpha ceranae]
MLLANSNSKNRLFVYPHFFKNIFLIFYYSYKLLYGFVFFPIYLCFEMHFGSFNAKK